MRAKTRQWVVAAFLAILAVVTIVLLAAAIDQMVKTVERLEHSTGAATLPVSGWGTPIPDQPAAVVFSEERAKGHLDRAPTNISWCDHGVCVVIGKIDEHDIVHWTKAAKIEMFEELFQTQQDTMRWQVWQMDQSTRSER